MISLLASFFLAALVYSMAGFAGGSTYLALLAWFDWPYTQIPVLALICNLAVSTIGSFRFFSQGHLIGRHLWPFLVGSVPAAYWGGQLALEKKTFSLLLGLALLASAGRLLFSVKPVTGLGTKAWIHSTGFGIFSGVVLGFFAGAVGIGGGIFLSPLLMITGRAKPQQAAASASLFIFFNSMAGLVGKMNQSRLALEWGAYLPFVLVVLAGGFLGSGLGSARLPSLWIQRVTALILFSVSFKLFFF